MNHTIIGFLINPSARTITQVQLVAVPSLDGEVLWTKRVALASVLPVGRGLAHVKLYDGLELHTLVDLPATEPTFVLEASNSSSDNLVVRGCAVLTHIHSLAAQRNPLTLEMVQKVVYWDDEEVPARQAKRESEVVTAAGVRAQLMAKFQPDQGGSAKSLALAIGAAVIARGGANVTLTADGAVLDNGDCCVGFVQHFPDDPDSDDDESFDWYVIK